MIGMIIQVELMAEILHQLRIEEQNSKRLKSDVLGKIHINHCFHN